MITKREIFRYQVFPYSMLCMILEIGTLALWHSVWLLAAVAITAAVTAYCHIGKIKSDALDTWRDVLELPVSKFPVTIEKQKEEEFRIWAEQKLEFFSDTLHSKIREWNYCSGEAEHATGTYIRYIHMSENVYRSSEAEKLRRKADIENEVLRYAETVKNSARSDFLKVWQLFVGAPYYARDFGINVLPHFRNEYIDANDFLMRHHDSATV